MGMCAHTTMHTYILTYVFMHFVCMPWAYPLCICNYTPHTDGRERYIHTCTHTHTYKHINIHIRTCIYIHIPTYTYTHTYIPPVLISGRGTYIHAHTHIYT